MTVAQLASELSLTTLSMPDPDRVITGGYTGDLLSWVMGRAREGDAWITIMANPNVIAVATLAGVSCVIVAENSDIPKEVTELAAQKEINLLRSERPSFELCACAEKLI